MRRPIHVLVAILPFILLASNAGAQQWSNDKTKIATAVAGAIMKQAPQSPSVSIGISIDGVPVMMEGFGIANPLTGDKATATTPYQIGSLTKQMTAALVLSLAEPKRQTSLPLPIKKNPTFSLDLTIDTILPQAEAWTPLGKAKIRHLLNMQSGFQNFTKLDPKAPAMPDTTAFITPTDMMSFIKLMMEVKPQSFVPGTGYEYSNTNYYLLAEIAEKVAGTGAVGRSPLYRNLLKERVFTPAGLTDTGFVNGAWNTPGMAVAAYDTTKGNWNKPSWPKGAGDVTSSARDMLRWHAALMGGKVINQTSLKTMFTPVAPIGQVNGVPVSYGMGWTVMSLGGYDWYSHNGSIEGFSAHDGIFVNRKTGRWVSAVILTNQYNVKLDLRTSCLAQLAMDNATVTKDINPQIFATCSVP